MGGGGEVEREGPGEGRDRLGSRRTGVVASRFGSPLVWCRIVTHLHSSLDDSCQCWARGMTVGALKTWRHCRPSHPSCSNRSLWL